MMENELHENIILDVLSRLPVKTIIRSNCVCKKWRDLVSDPYFVHLHHSRSRQYLMIDRHLVLDLFEVEHEVDYHRLTLNHVNTLDLYRSALGVCFRTIPVGSVNGLICMCRKYDATYIFNPVFEEYMILPEPRSNLVLTYGFGVSMTGEYKVIRVCGYRGSHNLELEVHTLGTNQWRSLRPTPYQLFGLRGKLGSGVFVNSHVYWVAKGRIYDFDLTKETLELFASLPRDTQESKQMLGVLKGCLSLFSWSSLGFTVWVMKDSWYKAIENMHPVLKSLKWEPLCLIDGSKGTSILIYWPRETGCLAAYCLNTNTILELNRPYYPIAMAYRPSFLKLQNFGSERVHSLYSMTDTPSEPAHK